MKNKSTRSLVISIKLKEINFFYNIRLSRFDRNLTAGLTKKYFNRNQEGFTLVELIVVVVIIGVLSAIAIPSFQNGSKKARQKGAAAQISTYIKAAQAFYSEFGLPVSKAGDLANYMNVVECRYHMINYCKSTNNQRDVGVSEPTTRAWNSTSGMYTMTMRSSNSDRFRLNALPQRQDTWKSTYSNEDYGVSGCFNYTTGATKVISWEKLGFREVKDLNC